MRLQSIFVNLIENSLNWSSFILIEESDSDSVGLYSRIEMNYRFGQNLVICVESGEETEDNLRSVVRAFDRWAQYFLDHGFSDELMRNGSLGYFLSGWSRIRSSKSLFLLFFVFSFCSCYSFCSYSFWSYYSFFSYYSFWSNGYLLFGFFELSLLKSHLRSCPIYGPIISESQ